MNTRKLPVNLENPIDNVFINFADKSSTMFKKVNLTPNFLTTISLFFGLLSVYLFYIDNYVLSALFFGIAYYFDCADGFYARKYNMVTKFGDYYDHIADLLKVILLIIVMYYKSSEKLIKIFPIILIALIFSLVHLGCQEIYYNINYKNGIGNDSLSSLKRLCPCNSKKINIIRKTIEYTRYFGSGTLTIVLIFFILMWNCI